MTSTTMATRFPLLVFCALVLMAAVPRAKGQAEGTKVVKGSPAPAVRDRIQAVERLMESRNDESITRFVKEQLSPTLRSTRSEEQWLSQLKGIRQLFTGFGTLRVKPAGDMAVDLEFGQCRGEGTPLHVELDSVPPHQITVIKLGEEDQSASSASPRNALPGPSRPPLTWENLRERLKAEESEGFSGSVLIVRNGEVVLHEGYGLADREKKIANRPDTIFAIGSTPIDFTKAAILKLEDLGKVSLSDSITRFLSNVPEDKKGITLDHLMTGRSGLRNFHGRPTDKDQDNAWIDRETAVQRILDDELLFAPGTDRAHSHSAFGLLAAIVEIVGEESYAGFLEKQLFAPAGMRRTRHYEDIPFKAEEVALGYGGETYGPVNSPQHWGKTSWLVMGSGGMVSTTSDLYQWNRALREGKLLSPQAVRKYWSPSGSVLKGGSMNGFLTVYTEGPESLMILCSNEIGREKSEHLIQDVVSLVNKPKFRLGVVLRGEPDGIVVEEVTPGSPGERGGLQAGDKIVGVNGSNWESEAESGRFKEIVNTGKPMELRIRRGDIVLTLSVKPEPG